MLSSQCSLFKCSLLQFSFIGSNLQLQCSLYCFFVLLGNWVSSPVPLISHMFCSSTLNCTQFIMAFLYLYNFPSHNTLPYIHIFTTYIYINLRTSIFAITGISLQQYSVYGIISYNISYNTFHLLSHCGVNYVLCISIYLFISILTIWIIIWLCVGFWNLRPATGTTIFLYIFDTLIYCLNCHINLPFYHVFGHLYPMRFPSHVTYIYIYIRPLSNRFNFFNQSNICSSFFSHFDNTYFVTITFHLTFPF